MVSIEFISRLCQKSGHQETGGRRIVWATAALMPFMLVLAPGAQAANFSCSWTDAGDNWTTTADWSNCNGAFPDNGSGNTYDATISTGSPTLTSAISIGNVTVDSGGTWYLAGTGAAATLSGNLANSGSVGVDYFGGEGGASLSVGGTLTNSNYVQIGNTGLSANSTLSATAVNNTGTIDLYGNGTNQAALKVSGAAGFGTAGVISGQVNLAGDSLVQFGSGALTSIASGGQLSLNGANAQVQISGDSANNNALTGLSSNAGYFYLHNGASLTTTTGLDNSNNLLLDYYGGEGGSSLAVGGTLTNSNYVQIGNTGLSANSMLSADAVANTGTIDLYGNGTNQAALKVSGAAGFGTAGVISGQVNLAGDSLVQFGSGALTSIASGGQLSLNGANAQVQISGNSANNNALTGLSSNAGTCYLRNGASLTTTTGLSNSNDLLLDYFGGDGGASLAVGGTLTNSDYVQIGNTGLSANTTLSADAVTNTGTIDLYGNGTSQASLKVSGAAGFGDHRSDLARQVNPRRRQPGAGSARAALTSIASGGQLSLEWTERPGADLGRQRQQQRLDRALVERRDVLLAQWGVVDDDDRAQQLGRSAARLFWRRRRGEPRGRRHPDQQQPCADRQYRAQRQHDLERRGGGQHRDDRPLRQRDQPGGVEGLGRRRVWHRRGGIGPGQPAGQHAGAVRHGRARQHRLGRAIVAERGECPGADIG